MRSFRFSNNTKLTINVKGKGDEVKPGDGKSNEDNSILFIVIGIIVIIIIASVLIKMLYFNKKKKHVNHESGSIEVATDKPLISPVPEKIIDKSSISPSLILPSNTTKTCEVQQPLMVTPTIPKITGPTTTTKSLLQQQETQITKTSQLPSIQNEIKDGKE